MSNNGSNGSSLKKSLVSLKTSSIYFIYWFPGIFFFLKYLFIVMNIYYKLIDLILYIYSVKNKVGISILLEHKYESNYSYFFEIFSV